jgi:hypothetical protein
MQVWRHQVSRPDILHLVPALLACARFPFRPRSGCRLLNGPSLDDLPGRHPLAKQAELQKKISPRQESRKTTKEEMEERGKKIGNSKINVIRVKRASPDFRIANFCFVSTTRASN